MAVTVASSMGRVVDASVTVPLRVPCAGGGGTGSRAKLTVVVSPAVTVACFEALVYPDLSAVTVYVPDAIEI